MLTRQQRAPKRAACEEREAVAAAAHPGAEPSWSDAGVGRATAAWPGTHLGDGSRAGTSWHWWLPSARADKEQHAACASEQER